MIEQERVALVTGAGKQRVGWHIARALAQRGYTLAIHYRTSAVEAADTVSAFRQLGVTAEAFQADLAEESAVVEMIARIAQKFGRIDVLVNTAAIWERKRLEEVRATDVMKHFQINTLGTFLCCQHVGLLMVRQSEGGNIVNFSDWAEVRPYPDYSAYFPSKGAITAMTRCFAMELGMRNPRVRVNCIAPGPVMLPPDLSEAERDEAIQATLVKREGSPENVAQAVIHLIENDFLTGTCLPLDGGRSVYAQGL